MSANDTNSGSSGSGSSGDSKKQSADHYSGDLFSFVVLVFLSCILVPWTISLLRGRGNKTGETGPESQCSCVHCQAKRANLVKKAQTPDRITFYKRAVFVVMWILWAASLVSVILASQAQAAAGTTGYNPFEVLELATSASDAEIKRAYKLMSVKWHPDKNSDKELASRMYIEVTRAYKTLTDELMRKNWVEYGNPDGPQGFDIGMALPAWLVEKGNSLWVLLAYVGIFMIAIPAFVVRLWYSWRDIAPNQVMYKTMQMYNKFLAIGMKLEHMIEVISASQEFADTPFRPGEDSELSALMVSMQRKPTGEKPPKEVLYREELKQLPYTIKNCALVYAHLNRMHDELSPALRGDLAKILADAPRLINGMIAIIQQASRNGPAPLALVLQAMKLAESLQQACWPHQELLQLPHVDAALLKELASRKNKNEKGLLRTFAQLPVAERRSQLLGDVKTRGRPGHVGLTDQQVDDVERVLAAMPLALSVDVTVKVEDEVAFISPLAIVSLFVRCARTTNTDAKPVINVVTADADDVKALIAVGAKLKGSAARVAAAAAERVVSQKAGESAASSDATSASASGDDEDTWQAEKEVTAKVIDEHAMPAHCPFRPDVVNERFWVVWGEPMRQLMFSVKKTNINPPGADNEVVKIVFQAPERPGKYSWSLYVISDAYLGCDVKVDVNFVVHPAPELPPAVDEIFSDEEISLSDDEADDDPDDDNDDKSAKKKLK